MHARSIHLILLLAISLSLGAAKSNPTRKSPQFQSLIAKCLAATSNREQAAALAALYYVGRDIPEPDGWDRIDGDDIHVIHGYGLSEVTADRYVFYGGFEGHETLFLVAKDRSGFHILLECEFSDDASPGGLDRKSAWIDTFTTQIDN